MYDPDMFDLLNPLQRDLTAKAPLRHPGFGSTNAGQLIPAPKSNVVAFRPDLA
jgi:hypothetical protein